MESSAPPAAVPIPPRRRAARPQMPWRRQPQHRLRPKSTTARTQPIGSTRVPSRHAVGLSRRAQATGRPKAPARSPRPARRQSFRHHALQLLPQPTPGCEHPRFDGPLGEPKKHTDLAQIVSLNPRQDDDDPEFVRKGIDRVPQLIRALVRRDLIDRRVLRRPEIDGRPFAVYTASIRAPSIHREAPSHPYQPRAKSIALPQLPEMTIRLRERFLRDVLCVFAVAQHRESNTKRQRRRLDEPGLELLCKVGVLAHKANRQRNRVLMHQREPCVIKQDAASSEKVRLGGPQRPVPSFVADALNRK